MARVKTAEAEDDPPDQRRLPGVAFGLEGFRERYDWEAWRDSLRV
jgi:hypothetical protein